MHFEMNSPARDLLKFNEITDIAGVKPYVLRFWESEFEQISPGLVEGGHKIYSQSDLDIILQIKKLLFEDKLSIPQVKAYLDEQSLKANEKEQEELPVIDAPVVSNVAMQLSPFDLIRSALASDLNSSSTAKDAPVENVKVFQDKDVVNLIQAKKKLTLALSKINTLTQSRNW